MFVSDLDMGTPTPNEGREGGQQIVKPKWIPPPVGHMKVNVDAALSKTLSTSTTAVVRLKTIKNEIIM
jgi:hypothetical protein